MVETLELERSGVEVDFDVSPASESYPNVNIRLIFEDEYGSPESELHDAIVERFDGPLTMRTHSGSIHLHSKASIYSDTEELSRSVSELLEQIDKYFYYKENVHERSREIEREIIENSF